MQQVVGNVPFAQRASTRIQKAGLLVTFAAQGPSIKRKGELWSANSATLASIRIQKGKQPAKLVRKESFNLTSGRDLASSISVMSASMST